MILVFELHKFGSKHVPFNIGMLQTVAAAFPDEQIRFHGEKLHVAEVKQDAILGRHPNIEFRAIAEDVRQFRGTRFMRLRSFLLLYRTLSHALVDVRHGERCLILVLSSYMPQTIFAASLLASRRSNVRVQVMLHFVPHPFSRRRRNPIMRQFDYVSALKWARPDRMSFLAPVPEIIQEVARVLPDASTRIDLLPHPANSSEFGSNGSQALSPPVRVGFVGRSNISRGLATFAETAERMKGKYGERIEFVHVGYARHSAASVQSAAVAQFVERGSMTPRAEFLRGISELHYVMLPLARERFTFKASGSLIDALARQKPIISTSIPQVQSLFGEFGDIGFTCDDDAQFDAVFDTIMQLDQAHYDHQVAALGRARASRSAEALAVRYREIVQSRFGL